MKKITLIIVSFFLAAGVFAQVKHEASIKLSNEKLNVSKTTQSTRDVTVYWEENFDGGVNWTTNADANMAEWTVDNAGSSIWGNPTEGWYFFPMNVYDTITEHGNWAWVGIVDPLLTGQPQHVGSTSIQFDNIDLSASTNCKITFDQVYRALNDSKYDLFVEFSTDGGATWTTSKVVNEGIPANAYSPNFKFELPLGDALAGQSNVSLRLRWETYDTNDVQVGYGWQVDNIKIVENVVNDLVLSSARINFYPAYINYGFSGFYAKLPKRIAENENAEIYFSADIINKGAESAIPTLKGTLTDPSGNVVVEKTQTFGDTLTLVTGQNDTARMWQDENVFTIPNPTLGTYTWDVEVSKEGVADELPEDNKLTYATEITENYYSHNTGTVSGRFSTYAYTSGGQNDATGVSYWFVANDTIEKINIFVHKDTKIGASFKCQLYKTNDNGETWNEFATSNEINISDSSQLDRMHEVPLIELAPITVPANDRVEIIVAVRYTGAEFYLGLDKTVATSGWDTRFNLNGDPKWYYVGDDNRVPIIDLVLHEPGTPDPYAVEEINADNVNIYPNPTNGVFNIENVRGADVEVFNLVGQRVFSAIEVEENISVDLSNLSEGTYVVRISGTNSVKTQKINLVK